jgi:hypothetical protein
MQHASAHKGIVWQLRSDESHLFFIIARIQELTAYESYFDRCECFSSLC